MRDTKNLLRSHLHKTRTTFLAQNPQSYLKEAITDHLLSFVSTYFKEPCAFYAFWPLATEPDITQGLHRLWETHYTIALPKITTPQAPLSFGAWHPKTSLTPSPFIPSQPLLEPHILEPCDPPSWVFVPCLGYDTSGHRLGYGQGYFDRTLKDLQLHWPSCLFMGVSFSCGLVPVIPHAKHDIKLHGLLTEKRIQMFLAP